MHSVRPSVFSIQRLLVSELPHSAYEKQIEVCHNINYSVDARLKSINEYIGVGGWTIMGKQFGEEMEEITELFEQLKGQFAAFIGTFDGWSCGKETRLREQLPDLESELQDLETQLEGHHDSCWAHLGKALLSALIEAAGCQGLPSSPWFLLIIVPTCAIAGYQAVRIGIELWKIYRTKQQIEQKEQEIDEADKVRAARRLLKDLGKESGESFRKYVQKPLGLWTEAANDAMQIKQWLEMGANQIEISEGVRSHTQETVKAYKRMARYLRVYADNVRSDNPVGRIDLAQCSVVDYAHHILPARVFEDKRNTIAEHNAISGPSTLKV
ncbi:hypothetical protein FRC17_003021 [Serendipita sp. 399]|nr:hypothetical protein FRC17_003021 [Serendipita sp. 399]